MFEGLTVTTMKVIELSEMKRIELDILKDVAGFCDRHGIRYYLAGGTLLGAIRHRGFIPWDDDIDLIMPRPDYMSFIRQYPGEVHENYVLGAPGKKNHPFTYAKVFDKRTRIVEAGLSGRADSRYGICIDIFPMDGVPEDIHKSDAFFECQKMWFSAYSLSVTRFSKSKTLIQTVVKAVILAVMKMIGPNVFIQIINGRAMRYKFDDSQYVAASCVPYYGKRERVLKSNYVDPVKVEFEGGLFNAPKGYNEYLSHLYGDYMELPPLDKRHSHHEFAAFWAE
jgi:lipopolysaccharide cholinephosphotransferase